MTVLAFAVSSVAFGACGGDEPSPAVSTGPAAMEQGTYETVSPTMIANRVARGNVLLVDVREPAEYAAGRAPKALPIPLGEVTGRLAEITDEAQDRPVAFICRSGSRSAQAAQTAVDSGMTNVINVDGGMGAWAEAGLPIVPAGGQII